MRSSCANESRAVAAPAAQPAQLADQGARMQHAPGPQERDVAGHGRQPAALERAGQRPAVERVPHGVRLVVDHSPGVFLKREHRAAGPALEGRDGGAWPVEDDNQVQPGEGVVEHRLLGQLRERPGAGLPAARQTPLEHREIPALERCRRGLRVVTVVLDGPWNVQHRGARMSRAPRLPVGPDAGDGLQRRAVQRPGNG